MNRDTKRSASESRRLAHEMIAKYRELARGAPNERTKQRIQGLIADLEKKIREIDD